MHEEWALIFEATPADQAAAVLDEARSELDAWIRRPFAPDTTESWEEIAARIVADGWGLSAMDCAVAMRCNLSMVRRARLAELRHPETGYVIPDDLRRDPLSWAIQLDAIGLTLRQVEAITGVPKSTLHDRLGSRAGSRAPRRRRAQVVRRRAVPPGDTVENDTTSGPRRTL
jgi:hypothetical protein